MTSPASLVDEISPREYGEDRIDLTLDDPDSDPTVFQPVVVNASFARTMPEGVVLPLELVIVGPSGEATAQRRVYRRFVPADFTFRPIEGGSTLVMLRELYHNRWWGKLVLDVVGDPLDRE